ncbi:hypothetical protein ACIBAG_23660 [Streptomyces sp. NPDC051243]
MLEFPGSRTTGIGIGIGTDVVLGIGLVQHLDRSADRRSNLGLLP